MKRLKEYLNTSVSGYRGSSTRVTHLHLRSAEVKNYWNYTCTVLICLHGVDREKLFSAQMACELTCRWHII
jgi:hypothetical protein